MDRVCTQAPPSSPISLTSPSPIIMRTPWQQAFYEEHGVEYESDFEQGGGLYNPGCSHPRERSSNTSSSSREWVFNCRCNTTAPPSPGVISPPESPLKRRVTHIDRRDASPQPMARGPRTRRGNKPTATEAAQLAISPKLSPRHASTHPRPPRPTEVNVTPNLKSKGKGCSYRSIATWRAASRVALPWMGQHRQAISQRRPQHYRYCPFSLLF